MLSIAENSVKSANSPPEALFLREVKFLAVLTTCSKFTW